MLDKIKNWVLDKLAGPRIVRALVVVREALNGKKAYLAGSVLILQGLLCLLEQLDGIQGLGDLVRVLQGAAQGPCVQKIMEGLGIIGLRAGIAKVNGNGK